MPDPAPNSCAWGNSAARTGNRSGERNLFREGHRQVLVVAGPDHPVRADQERGVEGAAPPIDGAHRRRAEEKWHPQLLADRLSRDRQRPLEPADVDGLRPDDQIELGAGQQLAGLLEIAAVHERGLAALLEHAEVSLHEADPQRRRLRERTRDPVDARHPVGGRGEPGEPGEGPGRERPRALAPPPAPGLEDRQVHERDQRAREQRPPEVDDLDQRGLIHQAVARDEPGRATGRATRARAAPAAPRPRPAGSSGAASGRGRRRARSRARTRSNAPARARPRARCFRPGRPRPGARASDTRPRGRPRRSAKPSSAARRSGRERVSSSAIQRGTRQTSASGQTPKPT